MKWPDDYIPEGFTPYHIEDAGIIFNCDCRDILPKMPKVDLVLTDPPYGISELWNKPQVGKNGTSKLWNGDNEWDNETSDRAVELIIKMKLKSIIWGGNYYNLPPSRGYLIWDKIQTFSNADSEFAWCSWNQTPRTFRYARCQLASEGKYHPTQKPLKLFKWCLEFVPDADIILDPFLGSGTTAVAAKELGRKFIGIEISEEYCAIAKKRLRQGVLFT